MSLHLRQAEAMQTQLVAKHMHQQQADLDKAMLGSRPKHQMHAEAANGNARIKASEAGRTGKGSAATKAHAL